MGHNDVNESAGRHWSKIFMDVNTDNTIEMHWSLAVVSHFRTTVDWLFCMIAVSTAVTGASRIDRFIERAVYVRSWGHSWLRKQGKYLYIQLRYEMLWVARGQRWIKMTFTFVCRCRIKTKQTNV